MNKRVVLRDVAARCGVHLTTVARAIKNDPRVRPETRAKIQQAARELGYSSDPMLTALSVYRTAIKPTRFHGVVAWVTNDSTRSAWTSIQAFCEYRNGAAEMLENQGYRVDDFWLKEPGLTARRASQILQSRGIRGLLICPLPTPCGHLSLEWAHFKTISFGYDLYRPALDMVTTSHYHNMHQCLRRLRAMGYKRIGFVIWRTFSKRVSQLLTAAYSTPTFTGRLLPLLELGGPEIFSEQNRKIFLKWCKSNRPDAVISIDAHILNWMKEVYRVPKDVAYVSPCLQYFNKDHAGVVEPSREIGRAAGNFLASALSRGEVGIPSTRSVLSLDGTWQNGETVEDKRSSRRKGRRKALTAASRG